MLKKYWYKKDDQSFKNLNDSLIISRNLNIYWIISICTQFVLMVEWILTIK